MASLLGKRPKGGDDAPRPSAPHQHKTLARISLWSADLLLLGICAYLAWGTAEPVTAARLALCIVTLAMGAWLSVLALRL
jgi:hypothetical protein